MFVYKLFLTLNSTDFSFLCKNCNTPEKGHPFSQQSPLKIEILSSRLFENLVGDSTLPPRKEWFVALYAIACLYGLAKEEKKKKSSNYVVVIQEHQKR